MPDHWHALLGFEQPVCVEDWAREFNRWVSRQTLPRPRAKGVRWQDGFHDTQIRTGKQFSYVFDYIERNPVAWELAETPADYRCSSANPNWQEYLARPWPWRFEDEGSVEVGGAAKLRLVACGLRKLFLAIFSLCASASLRAIHQRRGRLTQRRRDAERKSGHRVPD